MKTINSKLYNSGMLFNVCKSLSLFKVKSLYGVTVSTVSPLCYSKLQLCLNVEFRIMKEEYCIPFILIH